MWPHVDLLLSPDKGKVSCLGVSKSYSQHKPLLKERNCKLINFFLQSNKMPRIYLAIAIKTNSSTIILQSNTTTTVDTTEITKAVLTFQKMWLIMCLLC